MVVSRGETSWIKLDSQNRSRSSRFDRELIALGERTTKLLRSQKVRQNDCALATLDDFLGAVYALILSLA